MFRLLISALAISVTFCLFPLPQITEWASGGNLETGWQTDPSFRSNLNIRVEAPAAISAVSLDIGFGRPGSEPNIPYDSETELRRIAEQIFAAGVDIVLLRGVDFASRRSGFVDQAKYIAHYAGLTYVARAPTHKAGYVPFPLFAPHRHLGRVAAGTAVISRYPILLHRYLIFERPTSSMVSGADFLPPGSFQVVGILAGKRYVAVANTDLAATDQAKLEEQTSLVVANLDHLRRQSSQQAAASATATGTSVLASRLPVPVLLAGNFAGRTPDPVQPTLRNSIQPIRQDRTIRQLLRHLGTPTSDPAPLASQMILLPSVTANEMSGAALSEPADWQLISIDLRRIQPVSD